MKRLKSIIYTGMLYVMALMLVIGQPLATAHAEEAPAATPTTTETAPAPKKETAEQRWLRERAERKAAEQQAPPVTPAPATEETVAPTTDETATTLANPSDGETTVNNTSNTNTQTDVNSNATINNTLNSTANSGNAGVINNMTGGNAGTGNANADTTIINTVHSSVQGDNAGIAHFTADIYGNVNGDITLYPAINNATVNSSITNNDETNVNNNGTINNDITLSAKSGDATVEDNMHGGNATTGDANTVANLVNLINSVIAANKSFIGTINIHGSLNGDILISPEFIPQLIASNGGSIDSSVENNLNANLNNNSNIINNISLAANSGNATVADNMHGGNATTGTGQTNLTVLNLTGHDVIAKNSILVFVNVMGTWVGVIAEAPAGSTAAALGNGITSNVVNNQALNVNNNSSITNNLTLNSQSGDANVLNNMYGGNATSGNATASANILNIDTSTFSLTDWFGVLFINVFGEWVGSFGVDTEAGNVVPLAGMAVPPPDPQAPSMRFGFIPKKSNTAQPALAITTDTDTPSPVEQAMATLASARGGSKEEAPVMMTQLQTPRKFDPLGIIIVGLGGAGFIITLAVGAVRRRFTTVASI